MHIGYSSLQRLIYRPRVPEPEAMADEDEASAYEGEAAGAHFSKSDQRLVNLVLAHRSTGCIVDIGTGPGQIPVLLAKSSPHLSIVGIDLSEAMLARAKTHAVKIGVHRRVRFIRAEADHTGLPACFADVVICNSALHHFMDPIFVFNEMHRLLRNDGMVVIRDLRRPPRFVSLAHIAFCGRHYRGKARELFATSVRAAYTVDEVRRLIARSRLAGAKTWREDMEHLIVFYSAQELAGA